MFYRIFFFALCMVSVSALSAQRFQAGTFTFSHKKNSIFHLANGTKVEGTIDKIKRKKGLIKYIALHPADGGKKLKLKPLAIKSMYLPPSGWDKLGKIVDFAGDATQWRSVNVDKDIIDKGYVYFEQVNVKVKRKVRPLMMQLVNPSFSSRVRVYFDPMAKETASLGVAGVKVAGGNAKSYYIQKGDGVAYLAKKKSYENEFERLFGDCSTLAAQAGTKAKWGDLETHVFTYNNECK